MLRHFLLAPALAPALISAATPFESALELDEQPGISAQDPVPAWQIDPDDAVTSPPVAHNQSAAFTIQATGPDTLTFRWAVSSEPDYDQLRLRIGDTVVAAISGEVPWTSESVQIPAGSHHLTWEYIKDEDISEGTDNGRIDTIRFASASAPQSIYPTFIGTYLDHPLTITPNNSSPGTTYTSESLPLSLELDPRTGTLTGTTTSIGQLDLTVDATNGIGTAANTLTLHTAPALHSTGHVGWTWSGHAPWQSESNTFRSAPIADNQRTDLNLPVTGPAIATFRWRVDSEGGFDTLSLLLDGAPTGIAISDLTGWQSQTVPVPDGPHLLTWRYQKDAAEFEGEDAGWMDDLVIHDTSDPDADGISSILEVFLGTDPDTPNRSPLPTPTDIDNRLHWQIPISPDPTGITPVIELSHDLKTWLPIPHTSTSITLTAQEPTPSPTKFTRIRLSIPATEP